MSTLEEKLGPQPVPKGWLIVFYIERAIDDLATAIRGLRASGEETDAELIEKHRAELREWAEMYRKRTKERKKTAASEVLLDSLEPHQR